jgi:DNA-binding transcriptional ArsR family regulator
MPSAAQLNRVFGALADPTRRAILARLVDGDATVNELIAPFDLTQPTISKHLKVLERAGLVSRGREAQFRPVRLNAAPLAQAVQWLGNYRRFLEESFDRLDTFLLPESSTGTSGWAPVLKPGRRS